jgi:hypothetical protein
VSSGGVAVDNPGALEPIGSDDFRDLLPAAGGDDGGAGQSGSANNSLRLLVMTAEFTDPNSGAVAGVEATFTPPIDLTPYARIKYKLFANVRVQENVNFTCDGCAGTGLTQAGSVSAGAWSDRTIDLGSGPDGAGGDTPASLAAVKSLQFRIDGAANHLLPNTKLILALDDVAVVPK